MFILTFVIGLKTLFNKESKIESNEEEKIENNRLDDTNETQKSETTEDVINSTNDESDKIYENTIVEESHEHNINYIGIGILSMSSIFLCITIILDRKSVV